MPTTGYSHATALPASRSIPQWPTKPHVSTKRKEKKDDWYRNFNIDFILRAGVVYNNSKYFVGTSFVGRTYDYYRNNFSLNNGFGTLQVYAGFNFCLKKEHRKKNGSNPAVIRKNKCKPLLLYLFVPDSPIVGNKRHPLPNRKKVGGLPRRDSACVVHQTSLHGSNPLYISTEA